jgi:hypothetical protein
MLLCERSASTFERRYNMNNLGLGVDGLEVFTGFSINSFDMEQRHITYLCPRMVLRISNKCGEMSSACNEEDYSVPKLPSWCSRTVRRGCQSSTIH